MKQHCRRSFPSEPTTELRVSLLFFTALWAVALAGCSDENSYGDAFLPEGTDIRFGTALEDGPGSRIYYDHDDMADPQATEWKIYWNYPDNLDKIFIYSPQAAAGSNQAVYTVNPGEAGRSSADDVSKDDAPIKAGTTTGDYHFYALYPASAVAGAADGGRISVNFSGEQTPSSVTYDEAEKSYTLAADMSNCLMTAVTTARATELADGVGLQFEPFSSVLNIEVNGPADGYIDVTSVMVTSSARISGNFTIDYTAGTPAVTAGSDAETEKAGCCVRIPVPLYAASGANNGIRLNPGEKLNVMAFIMPNPEAKDLRVTVVSAEARIWEKSLVPTSFHPSQIHTCRLPKLDTAAVARDYSIWLSQLDPRTYISDISLPGAALTFNTEANGTDAGHVTQSATLEQLYDAGARAFQTHLQLNSEASSPDGGTGIVACTSEGNPVRGEDGSLLTLDAIVTRLADRMRQNHGGEFCVLHLADCGWGAGFTDAEFYQRLNAVTNHPSIKENIVTDPDPGATLADVAGKIILIYQLDTKDGEFKTAECVQQLISTVNRWVPLNGSQIAFSLYSKDIDKNAGYSPLVFGKVGLEINYQTSNDRWKPAITSDDHFTLMWYAVSRKRETAKWDYGSAYGSSSIKWQWTTQGSVGLTTQPQKSDFEAGYWFIYCNQANAGDNFTDSDVNIIRMFIAIKQTYDAENRNKFYMVYCGGASNSREFEEMTATFNQTWQENISIDLVERPYGWVMLNGIGSVASTSEIIDEIIAHNNGTATFIPGKKLAEGATGI